jgi:hypothetical protein
MTAPASKVLRRTHRGMKALCFTLLLALTLTLVLIDAQGIKASDVTAQDNAHPLLGQPFLIDADSTALTHPAVAPTNQP